MENTYFLISIAVLAAVLLFIVVRFEKQNRRSTLKKKKRVQHKAQLYHHHAPIPHHGLDSRTTSIPPRNRTAFEKRHQRAGEELRHGSPITANRLMSDDEPVDDENESGLAMKTIEFVPEDNSRFRSTRR